VRPSRFVPPAVRPASRGARAHQRKRPLRLLIADHDRILLDALESALVSRGFNVIGAAENGRRAVLLARDRHPDVAVLDVSMPVMGGLDAARHILRTAPHMGVLLLTGYAEDRVVHAALRVGVHGFVVKAQGLEDLIQAIRDVSEGAIYISPCYSRGVLERFAQDGREDETCLTPRELEMLRLIADGKTMKQAAVVLAISARTAECHRASVMEKLRIHDTAGLVRYAIREGLIVA
jgi:DNA-binding NarL/FixJ family response regulator